jgi:erythromycin esterase
LNFIKNCLLICILMPFLCTAQTKSELSNLNQAINELKKWKQLNSSTVTLLDEKNHTINAEALDNIIGKARVVAIGEPFHDAHEPLSYRNEVIKNLVTQSGFKVIALETGLTQSKRLYDHVLGKTSETNETLSSSFSYGFGDYKANIELIEWLRMYNSKQASSNKVKLYGVDLTGQFFPSADKSLEAVLTYIVNLAPDMKVRIRTEYSEILPLFKSNIYNQLSTDDRNNITAKVQGLINLLKRKRIQFTALSSKDDYEWALQQAVNAVQDEGFMRLIPANLYQLFDKGLEFVKPSKQLLEMSTMRELAMAENLSWIMDREGEGSRVLYFANNLHLQGHPQQASDDNPWQIANGLESSGMFLRSMLADDLVVIGTYFGKGNDFAENRSPSAPDAMGIDGFLGSLDLSNYIIDLRKIPQPSKLDTWLTKSYKTRGGDKGQHTNLISPKLAFDVLLYIENLSPEILLSDNP